MKELLIRKSKSVMWVYALTLVPMWAVFVVNNGVFQGSLGHFFGIEPRDLDGSNLITIFTSWLAHGNFAHIMGNSAILLTTSWVVAVADKNPLKTFAWLIAGSGAATWLLGSAQSYHIGASGLVFAIFGYVVATAFKTRHWTYLLAAAFFIVQYYSSIFLGLMPKGGVSLAAHAGGLIAGIVIGSFLSKNRVSEQTYASSNSESIYDTQYNTLGHKVKKYLKMGKK